jgi:tetratricopeptide (TPR) repeat protein
MNYALTLMMARQYPDSLAQFKKVVERDPAFSPAHAYFSVFYATTGRFAEALSEMQKYIPLQGTFSADAQGYSKFMLASLDKGGNPANTALGFAVAGDRNKAIEYLERAFTEQDSELIPVILFPPFDFIHGDPRYADLMRRLGLTP